MESTAAFGRASSETVYEEARPAAEPKTASTFFLGQAAFEEPFEEEYARIIPSPASAGNAAEESSSAGEQPMENLDIPAFMRSGKPVILVVRI